MITYILITVEDINTKLYFLETNNLKITQQKFDHKNPRNEFQHSFLEMNFGNEFQRNEFQIY